MPDAPKELPLSPGYSANFPQFGHGGIKLTVLFNNPKDVE